MIAPSGQDTPHLYSLSRDQLRLLLGSVFIIAACSLLYELLISSLSTYLLGSSVVHYSLTIGLFLFFMGVGAWMASYIKDNLLVAFISIEIAIGVIGGLAALILFAVYAWTEYYYPVMVLVIAAISLLIGMEIPLLTRILEHTQGLRKGISEVLAFDYLGALIASVLFPFVLLPYLGHLLTAAATGLLNLLVASIVAWHFRHQLTRFRTQLLLSICVGMLLLGTAMLKGGLLTRLFEQALYQDTVLHSEQSRFQKLVVTRWGDDTRLFLDGSLQFSSIDEYRYHETLVHLPLAFAYQHARVLVIGGGDGLAVRELLRYPNVAQIDLIDIDPAVSDLVRSMPVLDNLSESALDDARVNLQHQDAWQWLAAGSELFDAIIIDLPDPQSEDTARLYTTAFYQRVSRRLASGGVMITQATSPWFAPKAYWSIGNTLEEVFSYVRPAKVYVPSFGPWGFFIAADHDLSQPQQKAFEGRYFNSDTLLHTLQPSPDLPRPDVGSNRIGSLSVLEYYREGWNAINHGKAKP